MKLTLLEDGVLDYKGDGLTLATPNGLPTASLGAGIKPAPKGQKQRGLKGLEKHIENCQQCSNALCDVGKGLAKNLWK
jgi:hypothetical protein